MGGGEKINVNNDKQALGKRIAKLREERGWRQVDLAHRLGMSPRSVTLYEQQGPPTARLNQLDAVFGGALLRGTPIETLPLDGMTAASVAATNGASVPRLAVPPITEDELAAMDAAEATAAADTAADLGCVTSGLEPLGLVLDEIFGRLRKVEQVVAALTDEQVVVALARQANR